MYSKQEHELPMSMRAHLSIITLRRTPQRLKWFLKCNAKTLENWNVHVIEGIDGVVHKNLFHQSRLVSNKVLERWSAGAIGSALSHMKSWRKCIQIGRPMIIVEDDTILATELKEKLETLLQAKSQDPSFLLLGWNMDSLLQAEILAGLGLISLFEPAYPHEAEIKGMINCTTDRRICRLKRCFGLPAYRITPSTAKNLLRQLNPLLSEPIIMGRGIPTHYSETLDGALNNQYEKIGAEIVFPPLALALNNQSESLTRKSKPQNFEN